MVTHVGVDGVRYEIAAIDGDYNEPETWPVMEANARLIALCPEMFEYIESSASNGCATAAALIRKARGES
jgi:hypothetical protein